MTDSQQSLSWQFTSWRRTLAGVGLLLLALWMIRVAIAQSHQPNGWSMKSRLVIIWLVGLPGLVLAMRGGGTLNMEGRRLIRWRGIGFPLYSRSIPFAQIQAVLLSPGLRPGTPAGVRNREYNIAIRTQEDTVVVRLEPSLDQARGFAQQMAEKIGVRLEDQVLVGR